MKITAKTRYGIRALAFIAEKHNIGEELIRIKDISESQKISVQYLEQILYKLKKSGIVSGKRGPSGGYKLSKLPEEITVLEIFQILESDISAVDCSKNKENCVGKDCTTIYLWTKLNNSLKKILQETTLAELMRESCQKG